MSNDKILMKKNSIESNNISLAKKREDNALENSNTQKEVFVKQLSSETKEVKKDDSKRYIQQKTSKKSNLCKIIPLILIVLAMIVFYVYNNSKNNLKASQEVYIKEELQINNKEDISNASNETISNDVDIVDVDECVDVISESMDNLFPSITTRFLDESELYKYTKKELAYIRNEIYARKGYVFHVEEYKNYFENKDWYVPNTNIKNDYSDLNIYEIENVKLILELENR